MTKNSPEAACRAIQDSDAASLRRAVIAAAVLEALVLVPLILVLLLR
jgi:hypothetical protein